MRNHSPAMGAAFGRYPEMKDTTKQIARALADISWCMSHPNEPHKTFAVHTIRHVLSKLGIGHDFVMDMTPGGVTLTFQPEYDWNDD